MPRLACLQVPLFSLAARLRSEPELKGEAVGIFQGNGQAARLVAASRRARKAGLKIGMSLSQAQTLLPRLTVRARDPACEAAAQEALLEIAESFSPRVEDAGQGIAHLEIEGLERHFSGLCPERELGQALAVAAERAGLPARVGIASSKLGARVAAEEPDSPTLVPAGREAGFLAPLPLSRLAPELEVAETLRRWGIRSVGDFARLPGDEVFCRLGEAGRLLHRQARGVDDHPLIPYQPPPSFSEGLELEWSLISLEPFLFVARAALERLCRRLESRGLACTRLEISLRLEPNGSQRRSLHLPAPTCEAKTLLTLTRLELERQPPGAPVNGFTLIAHPDRPRQAQLSLFGPEALSPDRLATTLARLFALLGPEGAGSPRTVDAYRPESFALVGYAPPPPPAVREAPPRSRGLLTVRALRPPVPLEVITAATREPVSGRQSDPGGPHTPPRRIHSTAGEGADRKLRIQGQVKVASGPWTLEERWWSEEPVERDYWDVELSDGGLYRIFCHRRSGEWFADGIYD